MMYKKEISVTICTYNDNKRLRRAIFSVLRQSLKPYEIIVIDDFSDEAAKEIVNRIKKICENKGILIKYERNSKNLGIGAARAKSLELSEGQYIAFLDSDDYWRSDKLEKIMKIFESDENIDIIAHKTDIKSNSNLNKNIDKKINVHKWYYGMLVSLPQTSGVMIKNPGVVKFKHMRHGEDIDFFVRYLQASKKNYIIVNEVLGYCDRKQLSDGGLSGNRWKMRKSQIKIYFKMMYDGVILIGLGLIFFMSLILRLIKK